MQNGQIYREFEGTNISRLYMEGITDVWCDLWSSLLSSGELGFEFALPAALYCAVSVCTIVIIDDPQDIGPIIIVFRCLDPLLLLFS